MARTWARILVLLALGAACWPAPSPVLAEESAATAVKPFYRPGEVRNRFDAWEKRARKFEAALTGGYAPAQFAQIAARISLIATDIQTESRELARRYDGLLASKRKRLSESAAKQSVLIELGYGPDDLRYAANVAAYANSLAGRFKKGMDSRPAPPSSAPAPAPGPAQRPTRLPAAPDPMP